MMLPSLKWGMRVACAAALALLAGPLGRSLAESSEIPPRELTTPAEFIEIMENSSLLYEVRPPGPSSEDGKASMEVLPGGLVLKREGKPATLDRYTPSPEVGSRLVAAERLFNEGKFKEAIEVYKDVRTLAPDFHQVLTLIGEALFSMGRFEEARRYLEQAIVLNFIDYQAHWFLADTLWSLGHRERALLKITTAHVLNVNHNALRSALLGYRSRLGRPWKDWSYAPRVVLARDGDTVRVQCSQEWIGYCLAKAVWRYEPGYAQSKGRAGENAFDALEELEALMAVLAHNDALSHIMTIVQDGFIEAFLAYEVLAKRSPSAMLLLPREELMSVVDYLGRYR